ncbi:Protein of unknown function [Pyronema omphalodes CBS 100304]|uniref:Uncharacterized protein n=1 Tax=Pyronema omphalodes (strain CBS 100304) TaxID=1076935 RepID=U4KZS9_PYROM|nr:Protein of unknown function [Pyronema omphalodes CBS 100304]
MGNSISKPFSFFGKRGKSDKPSKDKPSKPSKPSKRGKLFRFFKRSKKPGKPEEPQESEKTEETTGFGLPTVIVTPPSSEPSVSGDRASITGLFPQEAVEPDEMEENDHAFEHEESEDPEKADESAPIVHPLVSIPPPPRPLDAEYLDGPSIVPEGSSQPSPPSPPSDPEEPREPNSPSPTTAQTGTGDPRSSPVGSRVNMRPINPPDYGAVPRVRARRYPSIESVLVEYENTPIDDSDEEAGSETGNRIGIFVTIVQVIEYSENAGAGGEVDEEEEEDGATEQAEKAASDEDEYESEKEDGNGDEEEDQNEDDDEGEHEDEEDDNCDEDEFEKQDDDDNDAGGEENTKGDKDAESDNDGHEAEPETEPESGTEASNSDATESNIAESNAAKSEYSDSQSAGSMVSQDGSAYCESQDEDADEDAEYSSTIGENGSVSSEPILPPPSRPLRWSDLATGRHRHRTDSLISEYTSLASEEYRILFTGRRRHSAPVFSPPIPENWRPAPRRMAAVLTTPIPGSGVWVDISRFDSEFEGTESTAASDSSNDSDNSDIYLSMRFWRRGDAYGMYDNVQILRDSSRPLNYLFNFLVGAMRPPWVDAAFPVAPDWFFTAAVSVDEAPVSVPVAAVPLSAADPAADPAPAPTPAVPSPAPVRAPTTLAPVHPQGGFSMGLAFRVVTFEGMDRVDVGEGNEMVGMISGGLVRRWDY